MDDNEREASDMLRSLGITSAWGCKSGVFISSEDAFKLVRLIKGTNIYDRVAYGFFQQNSSKSDDASGEQSGKGTYKSKRDKIF